MRTTTISHRYARALFGAALEAGKAGRVADDLAAVAAIRERDPGLMGFLDAPDILTEHKTEFLRTVFGPRVDPLTLNFLLLLLDKGRIALLGEIGEDLRRLHEEHQGLLRAEIVTASALDANQQALLKRELDRLTGRNVILKMRVDPSIIGGVVVHLGSKIIDRSLRRGLQDLSEKLRAVELN